MADTSFTLPSPYQQQLADLDRRQRMSEIMQQQAFQPIEQGSYNGIPAPISHAAGLAKMLQMAMPILYQNKLEGDRQKIIDTESAENKADMSDILAALKGAPGTPAVPGTTTATNADVEDRDFMQGRGGYQPIAAGDQLPTIGAPAVAPVAGGAGPMYEAMLRARGRGLQSAGLSGMASMQQAKDARTLALEDAERKRLNAIALKASPEAPQAGRDIPLTPAVLEQRVAVAQAGAPPPAGYQPAPGGLAAITGGPADPSVAQALATARRIETARPIPANINTAISENMNAVRKIDSALGAIKEYPDATGAKAIAGDFALSRLDPTGVNARALIADIGSMKIHDRSGAAVTAAETPRLKPFIPSAFDRADTIKTKLANFRNEYMNILNDMSQVYSGDQGYRDHPALSSFLAGGQIDTETPSAGKTLRFDANGNKIK